MKRPPPPRGYDRRRRPYWTEFECPACTAENPYDERFGFGDEVSCHYCQALFRVSAVEGAEPPRYCLEFD